MAGCQAEAADLLEDAVFVDLYVAGLEILDELSVLIANDKIQSYLVHSGPDRRTWFGWSRGLRNGGDAQCEAEQAHQATRKPLNHGFAFSTHGGL
jgi:hypothetical protein